MFRYVQIRISARRDLVYYDLQRKFPVLCRRRARPAIPTALSCDRLCRRTSGLLHRPAKEENEICRPFLAGFQSNRECFFIGRAIVFQFYAGMRAGRRAISKAASWTTAVHPAAGPAFARRLSRLRRQEQQTKNIRVAVVLSLFLVLLVAALPVAGGAVINPPPRTAAEQREPHRMGDIVFTMPDGALCRHLWFDNKTAEISAGGIQQCRPDRIAEPVSGTKSFVWGAR